MINEEREDDVESPSVQAPFDEESFAAAPIWAAEARNRDWMATLRPWREFVGLSDWRRPGGAFSIPSPSRWDQRVSSNVKTFLSNYLLVAAVVSLIQVISHPIPVLLVIGTGLLFRAIVAYVEDRAFSLTVGGSRYGSRHLGFVFVLLTTALGLFMLGEALFLFLGISFSIIFMHALLRHTAEGSVGSGAPTHPDHETDAPKPVSTGPGVLDASSPGVL